MKKNMKKAAALTLSAVMAAGLLTGCGSSDGGASAAKDTSAKHTTANSGAAQSGSENAGGIDLSEHVDLTMYLLGDRTADFEEV